MAAQETRVLAPQKSIAPKVTKPFGYGNQYGRFVVGYWQRKRRAVYCKLRIS